MRDGEGKEKNNQRKKKEDEENKDVEGTKTTNTLDRMR